MAVFAEYLRAAGEQSWENTVSRCTASQIDMSSLPIPEMEFQLDKAGTQCALDKRLLEARIVTLDQQYTEITAQKDLVIEKQQAIIKKQAPQRKWLWFAGGIVLGGASYYGIQQAVTQ